MNEKCFALMKNGSCLALTETCCQDSPCAFFKTEAELEESKAKSHARLASLDRHSQQYIADTYYGGIMPWLNGSDGRDTASVNNVSSI